MKMTRQLVLAVAVASVFALSACKKEEPMPAPKAMPTPSTAPAPAATPLETAPPAAQPVTVTAINLGNAIGADKNVTAASTTFAPNDTIYAAVATSGAASNATLVARWTFGGDQLVDETSESIAPTGNEVTSFHIAKPDGFPAGNYKIEVSLDGNPVASKDFEVK